MPLDKCLRSVFGERPPRFSHRHFHLFIDNVAHLLRFDRNLRLLVLRGANPENDARFVKKVPLKQLRIFFRTRILSTSRISNASSFADEVYLHMLAKKKHAASRAR